MTLSASVLSNCERMLKNWHCMIMNVLSCPRSNWRWKMTRKSFTFMPKESWNLCPKRTRTQGETFKTGRFNKPYLLVKKYDFSRVRETTCKRKLRKRRRRERNNKSRGLVTRSTAAGARGSQNKRGLQGTPEGMVLLILVSHEFCLGIFFKTSLTKTHRS